MKKISIIGLNPAWQKVLAFTDFQKNTVNRAVTVSAMASGKGINAARAARCWNQTIPCVFQFAGGTSGQNILEYLNREGISHCTGEIPEQTRTCTTQICKTTGTSTELIEPSPHVSEEQVDWLEQKILAEMPHTDGLAVCGTFPPGVPDDFYARIIRQAIEARIPVLLDSFARIHETLQNPVDILKINRHELQEITGMVQIQKAMTLLFRQYPVRKLAITDGQEHAWFMDREDCICHKISIPRIDKPVNTIGSGDTCSAVTLSEIVCGTNPLDAFRYGLAAATANCLNEVPGMFIREKALELFSLTHYCKEKI